MSISHVTLICPLVEKVCVHGRLMKQRKILLDNALCFILLRLCYNRLRAEWYPGGYPPRADARPMQHMPGEISPAGTRLLQVSHIVGSQAVRQWQFTQSWSRHRPL